MPKKIKIKAAKDAPDVVAHGNFVAEKKSGYYETVDERFADHIRANYGVAHTDSEPATEKARKSRKKSKGKAKPAATATAEEAKADDANAKEGGIE